MTSAENICSVCMCNCVKFYHLKDSIKAPSHLRFEGHTDLQVVLEKILNKKGEYRKASNVICRNCCLKLHGIYSFTHQHTESEKIFHQITDVTVRLKKLKTFSILTDSKTEFEAVTEIDKDMHSPECSSTVTDIECDDSAVFKVMVKNEFGNNFEGTDFSKLTKDLCIGLLEGEYSNATDARSGEQKKIDSIGNADSEQITIKEEIIKEEWTMQEGEIFGTKTKRDVLNREQTKFSCDVCDEVVATVSCLSEHTKNVLENDSHDFNQADVEHNTEKEEHNQRCNTMQEFAHSITNHSCDQCERKFKYKYRLTEHKQWHAGVVFKCDHCDAKFKTKGSLRQHKMFGIKFSCNQCDASLSSKWSLKNHLQTVHTDAVFSCDHCDATYKNKLAFNEHKQMHNGILFNCDQCDVKYKTRSGLRRHKKSHAGITFACNQCDVSLSSKGCLKNHQRKVHTNELLGCKYYCCNKKFTTNASLRRHRLSRICKSCKCDRCDIKLSNKKSFRQHLKMVHSITNYSCDQCEREFKYKYRLREHKQWHAGVVFKCDHCDRKYQSSSGLKQHKMLHAGITFACDKCDTIYKSSAGLRQHKMSHTDITFACNQCDASLFSKWNLKVHLQTVHQNALFACEHCDAIYKNKQTLNTHKMFQHTSYKLLAKKA